MVSNKELIKHLESTSTNAGFIDKLKIKYRPIICPFDLLLKYASDKNSAFDIGCGSGQFVSVLAKFTEIKKLKGIEISRTLIDNAKEINSGFSKEKAIEFEIFDGKNIPNNINEYELVFLIDVLHHVPKSQQYEFIKGIQEKMSSGSTLVIKDIDGGSPLVIFNKLHDLIFSKEIGNEISYSNLLNFSKKIGFEIVESFSKRVFVYAHYFIVLKKR